MSVVDDVVNKVRGVAGRSRKPSSARGDAKAPAQPTTVSKRSGRAITLQTAKTGFVLIHYHKRCPYGEVVGSRIPVNKDAAVKLAVDTVVSPSVDEIIEPEVKSLIKSHIKSKRFDEALALWTDYMQRIANAASREQAEAYPEQLIIRELPITED